MQYRGMNLCDFCFEPLGNAKICPKCGLTHENYQLDAGLLMPGTNLFGKYIIGRVLGRGGFGATYLAYSVTLKKIVAVKEYLPISIAYRAKDGECVSIISEDKKSTFEKGAKRFFEEAKTISKFNVCNNIVSVYEFFYANNTVYFSMEYLDGVDLKKYIAQNGGKLDPAEVLRIIKNVCNALMVVHSTQTLHRDISPDNIFMCKDGDIKLIDFGAAKQVISNEQQSYSVVVKQGFAPAEQYSSNGKQGVWTDIYAVGATMYYALLGDTPPNAIDRTENPDLNIGVLTGTEGELFAIIDKCMKNKISDRYQNILDLINDLDKIKLDENTVDKTVESVVPATQGYCETIAEADNIQIKTKQHKFIKGKDKKEKKKITESVGTKIRNVGFGDLLINLKRHTLAAFCIIAVLIIFIGVFFVDFRKISVFSAENANNSGFVNSGISDIKEHTEQNETDNSNNVDDKTNEELSENSEQNVQSEGNISQTVIQEMKKTCSVCGSTEHTEHPKTDAAKKPSVNSSPKATAKQTKKPEKTNSKSQDRTDETTVKADTPKPTEKPTEKSAEKPVEKPKPTSSAVPSDLNKKTSSDGIVVAPPASEYTGAPKIDINFD